jgi:hypothetical protein
MLILLDKQALREGSAAGETPTTNDTDHAEA